MWMDGWWGWGDEGISGVECWIELGINIGFGIRIRIRIGIVTASSALSVAYIHGVCRTCFPGALFALRE